MIKKNELHIIFQLNFLFIWEQIPAINVHFVLFLDVTRKTKKNLPNMAPLHNICITAWLLWLRADWPEK